MGGSSGNIREGAFPWPLLLLRYFDRIDAGEQGSHATSGEAKFPRLLLPRNGGAMRRWEEVTFSRLQQLGIP